MDRRINERKTRDRRGGANGLENTTIVFGVRKRVKIDDRDKNAYDSAHIDRVS